MQYRSGNRGRNILIQLRKKSFGKQFQEALLHSITSVLHCILKSEWWFPPDGEPSFCYSPINFKQLQLIGSITRLTSGR